MKIQEFNYTKKDVDISHKEVLVLHSSKQSMEGIDLKNLSEEQRDLLFSVQREYLDKLKPFMVFYRKYLVERMGEIIVRDI